MSLSGRMPRCRCRWLWLLAADPTLPSSHSSVSRLVSSSFHFLSYDSRHRVCTFPPAFAAVPTPLHHSSRPGHPHPSSLPTRHTDSDSPPTLGALHRHHPARLHQASPSSFDIIVTQHVLLPLASNVSSATSASFTIICHVALRLLWSMLPLA